MKKIIEAFRAWLRGDEIEAEFSVPVLPLLLLVGLILFVILKACL